LGWRRVWIYAVLVTVSTARVNMLPFDPRGPLPRDLPNALLTPRVQNYFQHNWAGYRLMVDNIFASAIAEEPILRGVLLPRTRAVFGRGNAVANGALFSICHLTNSGSSRMAPGQGGATAEPAGDGSTIWYVAVRPQSSRPPRSRRSK